MRAATASREEDIEPIGEQAQHQIVVAHPLIRQAGAHEAGPLGHRRREIGLGVGLEDVEPPGGVGPQVEPNERLQIGKASCRERV